jgi:hexosaminidase
VAKRLIPAATARCDASRRVRWHGGWEIPNRRKIMRTKRFFIIVIILFSGAAAISQEISNIKIIPKPSSIEIKNGSFTLNNDTVITAADKTRKLSKYLQDVLKPATGYTLKIAQTKPQTNYILLSLDDSNMPAEGYNLSSDANKIIIRASGEAGLFYGIQTLRQLLPSEIFSSKQVKAVEWSVPAAEIRDTPCFAWRGLHLDTCRHFMPADFIKKFIDLMAVHKMNTFHWHLTDDQGWRIEIKKYPLLTEIGAWRKETLIGHSSNTPSEYDGRKYGGFYTQQQIREIVQYAGDRYINIVPEIEMPGHSLAALAAYPELSCTGGPHEVATKWGVFDDVYCAGNEQTFVFLQNVLSEVIELFPGRYIHIGGDECPKTRWEKCPKCQQRMHEENLKNEHELQSYFIKRIGKYLNEHGKILVGWDEILEGGLAPNAVVMSWRGTEGGIAAAKASHLVVMSPGSHCYLDHYQGDSSEEPLAIGGFLPLEKVYSYNPIPEELDKSESKYILGVQGNIWTEYMKTPNDVEYMAYPRAIAIAEIGWSDKPKDFNDFQTRLDTDLKRLDKLNVNYRKNKTK